MVSEMYVGTALTSQRPNLIARAFLSSDQRMELDEIEGHEINEQLERYVRQLRHCQQPEELVRQNAAAFIATTDDERAATFGDPQEDEDARAEAEQARLDAIQERYWDSRVDAAKEGES